MNMSLYFSLIFANLLIHSNLCQSFAYSNGRQLQASSYTPSKQTRIDIQTARELAVSLLEFDQFTPDKRPNIRVRSTRSRRPNYPKSSSGMDGLKQFQKNSQLNDININGLRQFEKSNGGPDYSRTIENNPLFQKNSGPTRNAEKMIESNPLFKMKTNIGASADEYQQKLAQRAAETQKRRQLQLEESLQERNRLQNDPEAKPAPSKLKQKEQKDELFNLYNDFSSKSNLSLGFSANDLFEKYQEFLKNEIMKNSTYNQHVKKAANFFGYEDIAEEFDEKIRKKNKKPSSQPQEQVPSQSGYEPFDDKFVSLIPN